MQQTPTLPLSVQLAAAPPPMHSHLDTTIPIHMQQLNDIQQTECACANCKRPYSFMSGVGPYCSHKCAELFYSDRLVAHRSGVSGSGSGITIPTSSMNSISRGITSGNADESTHNRRRQPSKSHLDIEEQTKMNVMAPSSGVSNSQLPLMHHLASVTPPSLTRSLLTPSAAMTPRQNVESLFASAAGGMTQMEGQHADSVPFQSNPIRRGSAGFTSSDLPLSSSSYHSPTLYPAARFNSPGPVFRQTGSQSQFLHHDPSPEPSYRHGITTPLMSHKYSLDTPLLATTVLRPPMLPTLNVGQRRGSITRVTEHSDDLFEHESHLDESSDQNDQTPTPKSSTSVSAGSTSVRATASVSGSAASTPTGRMVARLPALTLGTPTNSAPTTPMGQYLPPFAIPSLPVVRETIRLVPSPRMESKLQQASRAQREATRHLKGERSANEGEKEQTDQTVTDVDESASMAAAAARKRKRKRSQRPLSSSSGSGSTKKRPPKAPRIGTEEDVPVVPNGSPDSSGRSSRRKSIPPTPFGEGDHSLAHVASRKSTSGSVGEVEAEVEPEEDLPKDKDCELCHKKHCGTYGGGRFCSSHCARHYSIVHRWEKQQQQ